MTRKSFSAGGESGKDASGKASPARIIALLLLFLALLASAPAPPAYAAGNTVALPAGTTVAYDADNADPTLRTVVGSGSGNRVDVVNASDDSAVLSTAVFLAPGGWPWIAATTLMLVAGAGVAVVRRRNRNISQIRKKLVHSGKVGADSGDGFGGLPHSSGGAALLAVVLAFALAASAASQVIPQKGFADLASSLTISNTTTGEFANREYAFPMLLSIRTPADAPANASYAVTMPGGTTGQITTVNHVSQVFSFALADGEQISIAGLPVNTVYRFEQASTHDAVEHPYVPSISYMTDFTDAAVTFSGNAPTGATGTVTGLPSTAGTDFYVGMTYSWTGEPSLEGYDFAGWSVSPDATAPDSGLEYVARKTYSLYIDSPQATIYPVWSRSAISVRFDANGGSGTMAEADIAAGDTIPACTFEPPTGYVFGGWAISAADAVAGTAVYQDQATLTDVSSGNVLDLYAIWYRNIAFYHGSNKASTTIIGQYWDATAGIGTDIAAPPASTCADISGFTELGWRTDGEAAAIEYAFGASFAPTATAYYAVYSRTVTFHHGYNGASSSTATQYYSSSNKYAVATPVAAACADISGWTEEGWRDDTFADVKEYDFGTSSPSSAVSFYAVYSRSGQMGYNANGGSGTTGPTTSNLQYLSSAGTAISPNALTVLLALNGFSRSGYLFSAWDLGAAGTNYSWSPSYNAAPDKTAYALWTGVPYSVRFNANGGSGSMSDQTGFVYGTAKALASNGFAAPSGGWSFQGWATSQARATAGTVDYANGANMAYGSTTNNGTVNLYAVWKRTISFKSGASNNMTSNVTQLWNGASGAAITTPAASASADISGWTELGWRDDSNAGVKEYDFSASVVPTVTTYYAAYSRGVHFYSGKSKATDTIATQFRNGETHTVTTPTGATCTDISTWTELGWRADSTASTAARGFNIAWNSSASTFYAVYSRTLTISYNGNGGSGTTSATTATQYYNSNSNITNPTMALASNGFTRSGCTFNKWAMGSASGSQYSAGTSNTASTYGLSNAVDGTTVSQTAYALWELQGTAYAVLDGNGKLTLFRSDNAYSAGASQTVTDISGNTYTGQVYTGIETTNATDTSNSPWYDQCSSVKSVDIADGQVIAPVNTAFWFSGCSNLEICDLDGLDTSNVTNMRRMFFNCYGASFITPDVSKWNTSKVKDMSSMFGNWYGASVTTPDVSKWDTSSVTDMSYMFSQCRFAAPDLSKWNTSNVTNMDRMFYNCGFTSIDVSGWDVSKTENMSCMFQYCSNLKTIYTSASADWNTSAALVYGGYMFSSCVSLKGGNGTAYNNSHLDKTYARVDGLGGQPGYFTAKRTSGGNGFMAASSPQSSSAATLAPPSGSASLMSTDSEDSPVLSPAAIGADEPAIEEQEAPATNIVGSKAKHATFAPNGATGKMNPLALDDIAKAPKHAFTAPAGCSFIGWNTSADASGTWYKVGSALPTDTDLTLYACWARTDDSTAYAVLDNAGKLTLFRSKEVYEAGPDQTVADIAGNTYIGRIYTGIEKAPENTVQPAPWFTERSLIKSVSIPEGQAIAPASCARWFYGCSNPEFTEFRLDNLDTSHVSSMASMFAECISLTSVWLANFETGEVCDFSSMFAHCPNIASIDLSSFDVAKAASLDSMFEGCAMLLAVNYPGLKSRACERKVS